MTYHICIAAITISGTVHYNIIRCYRSPVRGGGCNLIKLGISQYATYVILHMSSSAAYYKILVPKYPNRDPFNKVCEDCL